MERLIQGQEQSFGEFQRPAQIEQQAAPERVVPYIKANSRAEALDLLTINPDKVIMYMDSTESSVLESKVTTSNITLASQHGLWPRPIVNIEERGLGPIGVAVDKALADRVISEL